MGEKEEEGGRETRGRRSGRGKERRGWREETRERKEGQEGGHERERGLTPDVTKSFFVCNVSLFTICSARAFTWKRHHLLSQGRTVLSNGLACPMSTPYANTGQRVAQAEHPTSSVLNPFFGSGPCAAYALSVLGIASTRFRVEESRNGWVTSEGRRRGKGVEVRQVSQRKDTIYCKEGTREG